MPFKFERLIVWQKAIDLSAEIDRVTKKFPREEIYILTSQIKRATDSIALNIAEGSTGQTNAEFKRFLTYASRSDIEVVSGLFLAKRRGIMDENDFQILYRKCEEILVMINGLKKSIDKQN